MNLTDVQLLILRDGDYLVLPSKVVAGVGSVTVTSNKGRKFIVWNKNKELMIREQTDGQT